MALHFNPLKGITRALNIPDSSRGTIHNALRVVFPPILASELAWKAFEAVSQGGLGGGLGGQSKSQLNAPYGQNPYNIQFQAPNYQAPVYGGGGGFDYPYAQNYGGNPWGSSMVYPTYSTPPSVAYSAPPQDRSWEDLVGLATTALPFFL